MKNINIVTRELAFGIRMVSLRGDFSLPPEQHTFSVALGNFDGVHTAHRLLLAAAVRKSEECEHCHSAVFCFDPPSSDYLNERGTSYRHLSVLEEKLSAFAECGIEYAFLADFPQLKNMDPADFIDRVLNKICHATSVICGFNFRFGKMGAGTPALLNRFFGDSNCVQVAPCCMPTESSASSVISSSSIRMALLEGHVQTAARLLGRPYSFTAQVVIGKQLGRTIGIPTINQFFPKDKILLHSGIYITRCLVDGVWIHGISNIGTHPTVDTHAPINCETHLLNFGQEIYGRLVTVEFLHRLRDEKRFSSVDELTKAIQSDIQDAIRYFQKHPK